MTGDVTALVADYLTLRHDLGWAAATVSADPCNPGRRLSTVRGFLRHLAAIDGATEVPLPGLLGPAGHRKPPHIYSDAELAELLQAAAGLPPSGGLRSCCYVTLFGLLACTGLRISEALALTCADVDLTDGVLTVRAGKRGRTRLMPLHATAIAPLRDYTTRREQHAGTASGSEAFFRTDRAEQISYRTALHTFDRLRRQLGWTASGRTRAPRIHDLRHRIVVRRIQAWHADGVDVDRKIIQLATYLGHVEAGNGRAFQSRGIVSSEPLSSRKDAPRHPALLWMSRCRQSAVPESVVRRL